jgi:hypothetical protein
MSTQAATTPVPADTPIDPRFPASAVPSIKSVRLSPGDVVELVNLSRSGVLVEGKTRFVPGTRVTVHFDGGFTPAQMKGKIVRCQVSSINGGALRYQSGIQFEKRLDTNPGESAVALPIHPTAPSATTAVHPAAVPHAADRTPAPPAPRRLVNRW